MTNPIEEGENRKQFLKLVHQFENSCNIAAKSTVLNPERKEGERGAEEMMLSGFLLF